MAVPWTFGTIPNGTTVPLSYLDDNFNYIESQIAGAGTAVLTISGGSTGLLPNVPTNGNVVLSGILNIANGGTGSSTLNGAGTVVASTSPTITTPLNVAAREKQNSAVIAGGVLTIDCNIGSILSVTLTANITSVLFTNVPVISNAYSVILSFTGDGTARTITWPASVRWPNSTAPTPTATAGKVDTYVLYTYDAGSNWFAFVSGQNA